MKKYLFALCLLSLCLSACSKQDNASTEEIEKKEISLFSMPDTNIINQTFSFSQKNKPQDYQNANAIIQAINQSVQCTLTPMDANCISIKEALPKFIFMQDESLERPSEISYTINKIKPLNGGLLHIYTKTTCNAGWFGLCQGNTIYVLENKNQKWFVTDIFATENM